MKGIILAGGAGTRLFPSTIAISKQILPIYDKPMIYYPLSTLMLTGIREILIISTPRDIKTFEELLGDGSKFGVTFSYQVQTAPRGLADAFILGEDFIGTDRVCLILGDNLFYGTTLPNILLTAAGNKTGATIFGYPVKNPSEFGVVAFGQNRKALSIEEKPQNPKSNYAVPGLYFYDNKVVEIAKKTKPSPRGELEITAVNNYYLQNSELRVQLLNQGIAWLDTGTHAAQLNASIFVEKVQTLQSLYISCPEEIAYKQGYISKAELLSQAENLKSTEYGQYLFRVAAGEVI